MRKNWWHGVSLVWFRQWRIVCAPWGTFPTAWNWRYLRHGCWESMNWMTCWEKSHPAKTQSQAAGGRKRRRKKKLPRRIRFVFSMYCKYLRWCLAHGGGGHNLTKTTLHWMQIQRFCPVTNLHSFLSGMELALSQDFPSLLKGWRCSGTHRWWSHTWHSWQRAPTQPLWRALQDHSRTFLQAIGRYGNSCSSSSLYSSCFF